MSEAIITVANEILDNQLLDEFPLLVWQTGSGTQTNMNVNEVIANKAKIITNLPVHPNDHVNMSQSSNDTFPTAMHIATILSIKHKLLPALKSLEKTLIDKIQEFRDILKVGRTHLQDAVPLTLGEEFSTYKLQITNNVLRLQDALQQLSIIPQGGSAIGTGLNVPKAFDEKIASQLSENLNHRFYSAANKFESIASHDILADVSGHINVLAVTLYKMCNDIKLLSSGPRCGLNELVLPQNEPGSSIMPGKVNPTQCEAVTMIAAQVFGNYTTITFAASQGHLQLNAFKPVIIYNILQSINLLTDGITSFNKHCLSGIKPNIKQIKHYIDNAIMRVTALNPLIGYNNSAKIAKLAYEKNISLREAAISSGLIDEEQFDKLIQDDSNKI
jgi:fumarate hydratase class II